VSAGAGVSGQVSVRATSPVASPGTAGPSGASTSSGSNAASATQDLAVAPAVAPWIAGRVGIEGSNEAGLAYTGRALRLDARHAFDFGVTTLSIGLGATAIAAHRPTPDGSGVFGGGLDVPLLVGWHSRSDIYALWLGPRGGFELLRGRMFESELGSTTSSAGLVDARLGHFFVGGLMGARVGFRHLHVAVELEAAYHHASGTLGAQTPSLDQVTLTPSGALVTTF
jgi:hypothetical protein